MFDTVTDAKPLADLAEMVTVGIANSATHAYVDDGVLMFRNQNIKANELDDSDLIYIKPEFAKKYESKTLKANDILVARTGYPGTACIVPEKYAGSQTFTTLIVRMKQSSGLLPAFVCRYINSPSGQTYVKENEAGSAQLNFGATALSKMPIILPPMELQERYLVFAEQSDKSKFVRFKSQFIEMFGELGKDDKGWGLTTLGECCELNPKRPRNINDELLVSFVPMPAVSEDGKIDCSDIKPYKEVRKGFTYFAENDVLFAKITPCMENGKGAVAKGLEGGIGSGSTEFHVLRPIPGKSNPYWLYILTMFESFRVGARKVMTGTGGQLRVPIGYLNDYPISLPPIDLQERFEEIVHQSDKSKLKEEDHKSGMHEL